MSEASSGSRLAAGVHAAGHVICFLHQCHFPPPSVKWRVGSIQRHSMAHLQVPITCVAAVPT